MDDPIHTLYLEYLSQKGPSSSKSKEYYQAMSQLSLVESELLPKLPEKDRCLLRDFCDTWGLLEQIVSEETFSEGFQLGARMILSILKEKKPEK